MEAEAKMSKTDPPYKQAMEYLEWVKWLIITIAGLVALGWGAAQFISQFQTKTDAKEDQATNALAHEELKQASVRLREEQLLQRVISVRVALELQNTDDRVSMLVELQSARGASARAAAQAEVSRLRRRIEAREQLLRNPARLREVVEHGDPLGTATSL